MTHRHYVPRRSRPRHFAQLSSVSYGIVAISLATILSCTRGPGNEHSVLLDTTHSAELAPEVFRVRFETSRGPFVVEAHRAWSPWGVDRFYYLVRHEFYDGTRFLRVLPGYIVQFGIHGDPTIAGSWKNRFFPDDTVRHQSNMRGRLSFASAGPHTRTTQLFINLRNNPDLDQGYAPIGEIVEGMSVVDSLYSGYGEGPPGGTGPDQSRIFADGNEYLDKNFPKLDYVKTARIVK
jgi:peptidyl-prolyl cis-trans isomerase A (cyclophilin A)